LGKAQMMGIRRAAAADEARLLGNRFDMFPIANPTRCGQSQHGLINNSRLPPTHFCSMCPMFLVLVRNGWFVFRFALKSRQLVSERQLNVRDVGSSEGAFDTKNPMSPIRGVVR
jgi:hypothetical protein